MESEDKFREIVEKFNFKYCFDIEPLHACRAMTKPLLASNNLSGSDDDNNDNLDCYHDNNNGDESPNNYEEEVHDDTVVNMTNDNMKDACDSNIDVLELKFGSDDNTRQPPVTPKKDMSKDCISAPIPRKTEKENQSQKPLLTESLRKKRNTDKTKNNSEKGKNKDRDASSFENALLKSLDKKIELEEKSTMIIRKSFTLNINAKS